MKVICVSAAKEYVDTYYPNDPLLKAMAKALIGILPKIEIGAKDLHGRWTSVKDGLPTEGETVLVWHTATWARENGFDTDRLVNGRWVRWGKDVTHWAPAAAWMLEKP